jgi:hypothetical protein
VLEIASVLGSVNALLTIPTFNIGLHLGLSMDGVCVSIVFMNVEALVTKTTVSMLMVEVTKSLLVVIFFLMLHEKVFP